MKKTALLLSAITLMHLINLAPANAQAKVQIQENVAVQKVDEQFSTKVNIVELRCGNTNAKILGENIKIEIIPDGIKLANNLNKNLYKDNIWYINQPYEFLDFIKIRVWDVNVFKDKLLADIVLDKNYLNKFLSIPVQMNEMQFELVINMEKGITYRDLILKLRQDLERTIADNKTQIQRLNSEISSLKYQNENLTKKLNKEK